MLDQWQRFGDAIADAVAAVQMKIQQIKNAIKNLLLVLTWMKAYGELALLYAEDLPVLSVKGIAFSHTDIRRLMILTDIIATTGFVFVTGIRGHRRCS
jgi:hypothetical protein